MLRSLLALALVSVATPAIAQTSTLSTGEEESAICTDRPTNGNYACTVPKGRFQLEVDTFNWLRDDVGGERVDVVAFTNPVIKYGLTDSSDVQINWSPYIRARTRDANGVLTIDDGSGDVTARYKKRLTSATADLQIALLPFVKLPTASDAIGIGKVEGGIAVPINYSVPGGWTITLGPQVNVLADDDGSGRHLGLTGLVNIAKSFGKFSVLNEIWTDQDIDPSGTVSQYSYNAALVWLASPKLQFDLGANFGLNRNTPDVVSYVGVSTRF
ncbi:transporter [Novosphingobium sp. RD2P27]|uniref:Transporter n=1 Tax=Novosphingobium kalidii TaxID=3230299 RepID=A0ABV2D3A8_9SPHN